MAKLNAKDFIASLNEMNLLEIKELVDAMKEEYGIDPTAVAVAAAPAAAAAEESNEVNVNLVSAGGQKIPVIADNGGTIKEKISKDEANNIKSQLEELGATVELA